MLPIKDPLETVPVSFDFADEIASAATPSVSVEVVTGTDASVGSMPTGAPTIAGAVVTQLIRAGVAGNTYRVRCVASGPGGEVLVRADLLRLRTLPAKA